MIYIAHLAQEAEGCDYTIGCGHKVLVVAAQNFEEAKEALAETIKEDYNDTDMLRDAVLYEVSREHVMPLEGIYRESDEDKQRTDQQQQDVNDYAQYQILKNKFEK
jgi:hypothetical protein